MSLSGKLTFTTLTGWALKNTKTFFIDNSIYCQNHDVYLRKFWMIRKPKNP